MARDRAIRDDVAAKGYEGFMMGRAKARSDHSEHDATVNDFSAGATNASRSSR